MEKVLKIMKSKYFLVVLSVIIVSIIAYQIGYGKGYDNKAALIDEKEVSYKELNEQVKGLQTDVSSYDEELETKESELEDIESQLDKKQTELEDLIELEKDRDNLESEKSSLESDVNSLKENVDELESKLADLQGGVEQAEGEPKHLGAGQFLVGMDLPPGRYEVFPEGSGSNFVVRDSDGRLKVNTILGRSGVESYVFVASEEDYIETDEAVRFEPVE
ncbi:hypothetical protein [Piscibacillus halophilus]|uniref:hypothetical protein n=1 Tax=Piscibacillus halophilus TaxID=571933 RepID=UPI0024095C20|nr:hypothetical protein [Piscibacillus halophilus]